MNRAAGHSSLAAINAAPAADARALGGRLAATPRLACEALQLALNGADLEAALACFSPGACLVGPDGSHTQGEAAIAAHLAELIARGAHVEIELRGVLVAEDLALAHERWAIAYEGTPHPAAAKAPSPTLVLRCLRGEWKLAIAAPWGWDSAPPLEAIGFTQ